MITAVIIMCVTWGLASFCDAVCFGKVLGEPLYEVWHIAKGLLFGILFFYILNLNHAPIWYYLGAPIVAYCQHEILYAAFRYLEVWRLDNKWRVPFFKKLWAQPRVK